MFSFCHNFCWLRDERFANHKILTDYCYMLIHTKYLLSRNID